MSELYRTAPEYIVEFPEITVPSSHKVEDFSGFVPVISFNEADRRDKGGVGSYSDGNDPQQECEPIQIVLDPVIRGLLIRLVGKGYIDDDMTLVQLGRDSDEGHTKRYEAKLKGLRFKSMGPVGVEVTYDWYESSRYLKDEPMQKQGFDFIKQEAED